VDSFAIPSSLQVRRGSLLGYTGDYAGDNGLRGDGLAVVALRINGEWVNPADHYTGYVDCRMYLVQVDTLGTCAADDGSGLIPPRYNPASPSLWEPNEWAPWLARKLYDTVGYPILCVLVQVYNALVGVINTVINALLQSLAPALLFLYRLSRLFEHVLTLVFDLLTKLWAALDTWNDVGLCLRQLLGYFIAAFSAAADADMAVDLGDPDSLSLWIYRMVIAVINQTWLAWLIAIGTGLISAGIAWQIVPWGMRHLRQAIGMGEG